MPREVPRLLLFAESRSLNANQCASDASAVNSCQSGITVSYPEFENESAHPEFENPFVLAYPPLLGFRYPPEMILGHIKGMSQLVYA